MTYEHSFSADYDDSVEFDDEDYNYDVITIDDIDNLIRDLFLELSPKDIHEAINSIGNKLVQVRERYERAYRRTEDISDRDFPVYKVLDILLKTLEYMADISEDF